MGDLLGPPEKSSGVGKNAEKQQLTFKEKAGLTFVAVNLALIVVCVGLIAKIVKIMERRTEVWKKKMLNEKDDNPVIIDVVAEEVNGKEK